MPAPVVVHKDVGGLVTDYQTQTAIYRATGREVRLHECRSACTLALGLPNVCVYPDSVVKFHQAYDPRSRQTDEFVSQQLFDSYPAAVRARLGGLTRAYRVLRGSELIALGVKNCNDPGTMVASASTPRRAPSSRLRAEPPPAEQGSLFAGLLQNMMSALGQSGELSPARPVKPDAMASAAAVKAAPMDSRLAEAPLPLPRPGEFASQTDAAPASETAPVTPRDAAGDTPLPPRRPLPWSASVSAVLRAAAMPRIIAGAHPILPVGFSTQAALRR